MPFFRTFYSSKNPEKNCIWKTENNIIKLYTTLIIMIRFSWAANQHIKMISEGLCDTENWSNDSENSALQFQ